MGRCTRCLSPIVTFTLMSDQIPIQLAEMSPPAFRATFPGVAYQLGNVRAVKSLSEQ